MKIRLIRHPKTIANESHIIYGRKDYPYASIGEKQYEWVLETLGKKLNRTSNYLIESSPRGRAHKLAKGIGHLLNSPIRVNDNLAEMDFGIFEGLTMDEVMIKYPDAYKDFTYRFEETLIPEGESYSDFSNRIDLFCQEIQETKSKGQVDDLIVVSHGGVTRELLERLTNMEPGGSWSLEVGNACIITLRSVNGDYVIHELLNK